MSDEAKKRSRAWIGWAALALLLLAHPLSYGPVLWSANNSRDPVIDFGTIKTVYAPINWLRRHCEPAKVAIDRYMRPWLKRNY